MSFGHFFDLLFGRLCLLLFEWLTDDDLVVWVFWLGLGLVCWVFDLMGRWCWLFGCCFMFDWFSLGFVVDFVCYSVG